MSALSANRQPAAMARTAIGADIHQALDVHGDFRPQRALDAIVTLDDLTQPIHVGVGQVLHARIGADAGLGQYATGDGLPNAIDVLQADFHTLLARQVDTSDSCHMISPAAAYAWGCACR